LGACERGLERKEPLRIMKKKRENCYHWKVNASRERRTFDEGEKTHRERGEKQKGRLKKGNKQLAKNEEKEGHW